MVEHFVKDGLRGRLVALPRDVDLVSVSVAIVSTNGDAENPIVRPEDVTVVG